MIKVMVKMVRDWESAEGMKQLKLLFICIMSVLFV